MALLRNDPRIWKWLESIGVDVSNVQRVIIDIAANSVVVIHVTKIADERMFDVAFPSGKPEIVTIDKPTVDGVVDATPLKNSGSAVLRKAP